MTVHDIDVDPVGPARLAAATSSAMRPKSADRMDGATMGIAVLRRSPPARQT
jgi:hypothetical protein